MKIFVFLTFIAMSLGLMSCSKDRADSGATAGPWGHMMWQGSTPRNPDINIPYRRSGHQQVTQRAGNRDFPYIAITFDDGPHPVNTPRLLDILRERNIKATFYVVGEYVARHPAIVRRVVAEGHEIGNHSWSHPKLTNLSRDQVAAQLDRCTQAIVNAAGVRPRTMRPPYGALHESQRIWIHQKWGYPTVLWDVDPEDWRRPGPSVVASRITNRTRNGSIVLAHDLHGQTVDAMPEALDNLLRKGFKFVTVSQLLAMKVY